MDDTGAVTASHSVALRVLTATAACVGPTDPYMVYLCTNIKTVLQTVRAAAHNESDVFVAYVIAIIEEAYASHGEAVRTAIDRIMLARADAREEGALAIFPQEAPILQDPRRNFVV